MILHIPTIVAGLAIMVSPIVIGNLTAYWGSPLWLVAAGGAAIVFVSLRRGYQRGRGARSIGDGQ